MNHLPTTKQLRYFVALEQIGHFGKAAEACFVSQPAFSVAIRELESTLNIQLVDRTNKNVTVTSLGRDIAAQARQVLRDMEESSWGSFRQLRHSCCLFCCPRCVRPIRISSCI